jgi:hypothetical protein
MKQGRSYYDLLGVKRTASPQEIRSAYLRLMKRHHPDAAGDRSAPNLAPALNRCYAVLKDPVKRSQYDARLVRLSPSSKPAPRLDHAAPKRAAARSWRVVVPSILALVTILWLAPKSGAEQTIGPPNSAAWQWTSPPSMTDASGIVIPLPERAVIDQMAGLARTVSISGAEAFSRKCYAGAARRVSTGAADQCVLFDVAFLYWRKSPASVSNLPVWFADQVVDNRHRQVMETFGKGAEQRLLHLRDLGFLALVRGIKASDSAPVLSPNLVTTIELSPEMYEGERERLTAAGVPTRDTLRRDEQPSE